MISRGSTISLEAEVGYATSDEPATAGMASDLFITPSLSLKLITLLPIQWASCDNGAQTGNLVTRWQMISGGDLYETLDASVAVNTLAQDNIDAAMPSTAGGDTEELRETLRGEAEKARKDDTWNAVTEHSLFDILLSRIPQLQGLCADEWTRLACSGRATDADNTDAERCAVDTAAADSMTDDDCSGHNPFWLKDTAVCAAATPVWTPAGGTQDCICKEGSASMADSACVELISNSRKRLNAASRGVGGWASALRLHDVLGPRASAGALEPPRMLAETGGARFLHAKQF